MKETKHTNLYDELESFGNDREPVWDFDPATLSIVIVGLILLGALIVGV